jgi:uncharacterized protein (DUF1501 family)
MRIDKSRRKFMKLALGGTCGAALHQLLGPTGSFCAYGDPMLSASATNKIMILVNMSGGASYNVAPIYDGTYRDKNPTISYGPENSIALNGEQGLHPSLTALKSVWDSNNLALLNMVGYPNPNRSHAESTDIWFRGVRNGGQGQEGWASRMTCQLGNIFAGVSLAGSNLLVQGECNPPRALDGLDSLGERNLHWGDYAEWLRKSRDDVLAGSSAPLNTEFGFVKSQMDTLQSSLETLRLESQVTLPTIANPFPANMSGFQSSCRDAAKLIAAQGLQTRFIYLQNGGFDTHSEEKPRLSQLLTDMNVGLRSLIQTIQALGRWNDVIIVTMSEFSRTFENGSEGTDHGHAAPMIVMGGGVKGGVKTPAPTSAQTAANGFYSDIHVDFRQVFQESVQWMGLDPASIFPERLSFTNLGMF